ncbi:MAG: hypothetical protein IKG25_07390 [Mogibacterium sp.]|nr:hypothetical protein [Mogibacterium sp.]MBR3331026.1 hypothetical protein [Mogibacterium sp.]
MTDLLEKDKDKLLTELSAAASADKAIQVLENEIDKLLLKHNEQCETDRERESAAYMMQAVRLSLPLIDSNGKIKVWESGGHKDDEDNGGSFKLSFLVLLIIGLALCVFGFGPLMMDAYLAVADNARDQVILHGGATIVGLIALYFSGYMYSRPKKVKGKKEYQVDIRVDADRIYRNFRTALLSVDQSLEEISAAERWNAREKAGSIDGRTVTQSELDLFSDLLAAAYSGDPEYALEKVEQIKYFLHRQQIEVLDYSKENEKYFDLMPGSKAATIRPAMVAQGGLLKKGLASTGR